MKIVSFEENVIIVEMPNFNSNPTARDAQLYMHIEVWSEGDEALGNIDDVMRQKWSDAALRDRIDSEISGDELMELMSVRGGDSTITP